MASSQCAAPVTATVGVKTLACTASDLAGNPAQASVAYTVAYQVRRLQATDPAVVVQRRFDDPVKFTLRDHTGAAIPDRDAQALVAACLIRVRLDGGLQPECAKYDARLDQFLYSLKTPRDSSVRTW